MAFARMPSDRPTTFTYRSAVPFDELDAYGMLHNARWPLHIERATTAWFMANGRRYSTDPEDNPDKFHVVRHLSIDYILPFTGIGEVAIELWVEEIGARHCSFAFRAVSVDGATVHATGRRTIVGVDPTTGRAREWTQAFREEQAAITPIRGVE